MIKHNKLVRDKIPEIIEKSGKKPIYTSIQDVPAFIALLEQKLDEEVAEFHESKNMEELADILEVVFALCENLGYSIGNLQTVCESKHDERGGFSKGILLVGVED